jgi:regulator of sirC expression with transglutaminase-like and TPR domain
MSEKEQIQSLIRLLDDSDEEVYSHVFSKISSMGKEVIPILEDAWSNSADPILHTRIEDLVHKIHFSELKTELKKWGVSEKPSLLEGALLVAKYKYPDLQVVPIQNQIEVIRKSVWVELNYDLTPLEQVNVFNQVFYGFFKFKGDMPQSEYVHEYFLNYVLETKKGNALSIGILYLILAGQLGLPVYGVTLPGYFILAYCKERIEFIEEGEDYRSKVLFYMNPVNNGMVFTRNEVKSYLQKVGVPFRDHYFQPAGAVQVIREMLTYLELFYRNNQDPLREAEIRELRGLL